MAKGYKVRLDDGSEIGPMELQAVKDWLTQGLINKDSMVQRPGSNRWVRLSDVAEVKGGTTLGPATAARSAPRPQAPAGPRPSAAAKAAAAARAGVAPPEPDAPPGPQTWRTIAAAGLLFAGAVVAGFWVFRPERWLPALDDAPWKEIALGQIVLGLALVRGWEMARRIVRIVLLLLTFGLFPVAGILLAQGMRGVPLVVLLAALVALVGFVALLAGGYQPVLRVASSLLLIVAGWGGVVRFGLVPESTKLKDVREWLAPERRLTEPTSDLTVNLPPAWSSLKKDQTLVAAPASAKGVFAQPRLGGFAYVAAEPTPRDVASLDDGLTRILASRKQATSSLTEEGRSDVMAGKVAGREAVGSWEADGVRYRDLTAVWRDGWTSIRLVAWIPDDGSSRPVRELRTLREGIVLSGDNEAHLNQALERVIREVPHLSDASVQMVMGQSEAHVLEPEETFRRAYEMASRGLPALSAAEARELGDLVAAASSTLLPKTRTQLTAYFERIRNGKLTTPDEDREMSRIMKGAVLRLAPPRQARLQALYEKAIRAAVTTAGT